MTILPKKKASQSKNDSEAKADHGPHNLPINHNVSGHSQTNDAMGIERLYGSGQNSPSCWPSSATREEKRPAHSAVSCFDEYETLDTGGGHSKRRLKASPHRSVRNKLRDRDRDRNNANGSASPVYPSTSTGMVSGGNCSPIAGPSFFNPEDVSGYNSGDEYGAHHSELTEDEVTEKEKWFEKKLRKKGLCIKRMEEDGACLFRAVADQVYGDQDMHPVVRSGCMDYMHKNSDYFSHYVTEDFNTYINRKRLPYVHGNHIEMQAMSEMFNRPIEVYCYRTEPINTFCGVDSSGNEPIRLSYHQGTHYNSIVDPFKATIGVGLGLPGLVPGMADKNLIKDAVRQSEDFHIEKAMLEDKLKATDWEATNEAIEEQIARESYLQWLRDNEKRNRNQNTRSSTVTSSEGYSGAEGRSPRRSGGDSPPHESEITKTMFDKSRLSPRNSDMPIDDACASSANDNPTPSHSIDKDCTSQESVLQYPVLETASVMTEIPPDIFGLNEWEDADVLARVLAASQQEYLDSLKKSVGIENSSEASSSSSSGNHGSSPRPNS